MKVLDPIPYGQPFHAFLRGFDAVIVPSLSNEQPRILFDAFSQAVPVIASATGGIREVVESELTGRLVPPDDVTCLAEALIWASRSRPKLCAMGMGCSKRDRLPTEQCTRLDVRYCVHTLPGKSSPVGCRSGPRASWGRVPMLRGTARADRLISRQPTKRSPSPRIVEDHVRTSLRQSISRYLQPGRAGSHSRIVRHRLEELDHGLDVQVDLRVLKCIGTTSRGPMASIRGGMSG